MPEYVQDIEQADCIMISNLTQPISTTVQLKIGYKSKKIVNNEMRDLIDKI